MMTFVMNCLLVSYDKKWEQSSHDLRRLHFKGAWRMVTWSISMWMVRMISDPDTEPLLFFASTLCTKEMSTETVSSATRENQSEGTWTRT